MHMDATALDRTFAALADPTRRAILGRLRAGEATVTELVAPFGLAQPTISKHLGVLERAGLVERRRDGQFRRCSLEGGPLGDAWAWLDDYRAFWEQSLDRLERFAVEEHRRQQRKPRHGQRKPVRR